MRIPRRTLRNGIVSFARYGKIDADDDGVPKVKNAGWHSALREKRRQSRRRREGRDVPFWAAGSKSYSVDCWRQ